MSYLIIASLTLVVVSLYRSISKIDGYSNMIERITPSWNISINLN